MAISYTISYTFTAGTTISSSNVNTNFSDNANTWTGLEALTKSFAALRVDATPTNIADVVRKDYVDKLNNYRRPVLQYSSGTVVNMESGINGTSGQAQILFPDGTLRTDSTTTRINCNLAQNAVLSGTAQSGLRTGSQTANTWYSFYAVKVTDSTTNFVMVADTVTPTQANYATLNSNFGTNGWVYLGTLANGNNSDTTNSILSFVQTGNHYELTLRCTSRANSPCFGIRLASTTGATSLTWTYASGTAIGSAQIPSHLTNVNVMYSVANVPGNTEIFDSGSAYTLGSNHSNANFANSLVMAASVGMKISAANSIAQDVQLLGYWDGVLGVGANPIL